MAYYGRAAFINAHGRVLWDHWPAEGARFSEGLAPIAVLDERPDRPAVTASDAPMPTLCGFIDRAGAIVITPIFEQAGNFSGGLAPVQVRQRDGGSRWGYIDHQGKFIIPPRFDAAGEFFEGLAPVCAASSYHHSEATQFTYCAWGYIDRTGAYVIQPRREFTEAQPFSEGLAAVAVGESRLGGNWGYIDRNGAIVIKPSWDAAGFFHDGHAVVVPDVAQGLWTIDRTGAVISKSDDSTVACGYYTRTPADFISPHRPDELPKLRGGNTLCGYVDQDGAFVIEPTFMNAEPFYEGIAVVYINEREDP